MTHQFLVTLTELAKVQQRADEGSEVYTTIEEPATYVFNIHRAVSRWAAPLGIGVSTADLTGGPFDPHRPTKPAKPEECCHCRFFRNQATAAGSGECHRRVPDPRGAWPVIQQNEWCGEFEPREKA